MSAERGPRRPSRPGRALGFQVSLVRCFYRRPIAWVALVVSAAFLTYAGGAVMFWFHAIVRGEAGPPIDNLHHWLLDSTLGFIALTPILALILPLGAWQAGRSGHPQARTRLGVYVAATATLFTIFTGPGPFVHDTLVGAGTPLAHLATVAFARNQAAALLAMHARERSPVVEGLLQVGVGLPVYLVCTWLALSCVRLSASGSRREKVKATAGSVPPRTRGVIHRLAQQRRSLDGR